MQGSHWGLHTGFNVWLLTTAIHVKIFRVLLNVDGNHSTVHKPLNHKNRRKTKHENYEKLWSNSVISDEYSCSVHIY